MFIASVWQSAIASEEADLVRVSKSEEKLYVLREDRVIAEYSVSFGGDPEGHKQEEGDEKTPEGRYTLDLKKSDSAFYKAIHISYPNEADRLAAEQRGVDPGGAIMIHGQRNGLGWLSFVTQRFNWTDGCIAVTNREMDEIWNLVPIGTPIEINK
jgi:murein L,D-transpeptidase YafK